MQAHYQFQFNLAPKQTLKQPLIQFTLLADLFPYYRKYSVTSLLFALHLIRTLYRLAQASIEPGQDSCFAVLSNSWIQSALLLRVGSEYEVKLGRKTFGGVLGLLQLVRTLILLSLGDVLQAKKCSFILTSSPSILCLFILPLLESRWVSSINSFPEPAPVENYDLLDLNDTVIKLKTAETTFSYESYSNREFYRYNVERTTVKSSPVEAVIEERKEWDSQLAKLYKLAFLNFAVYSEGQVGEWALLLGCEAILVLSAGTAISRWLPWANSS